MMSNRIQELIEKATENVEVVNPDTGISHTREFFDKDKFAQLLIQDCCQAIQEWKKEPFPFDEDLAVELIHQNFGLELPPKNIKVIKI
jgi:hypothetical protein